MRLKSVFLSTAAACALALPAPASAVTVDIVKDLTIEVPGPALVPLVAFGHTSNALPTTDEVSGGVPQHTLDGAVVQAYFFGASLPETRIWSSSGLGDGCGEAGEVSDIFQLSGCGNTYDGVWTLTNNSQLLMQALWIDLRPTNLWFDTTKPSPGTPGSGKGRDFEYDSGNITGSPIVATYSYVWSPRTDEDDWDAFKLLRLDFTGDDGLGGLPVDDSLMFRQDVDSVIPLPAALPLLITGIGLLGVFRRRRRNA